LAESQLVVVVVLLMLGHGCQGLWAVQLQGGSLQHVVQG